MKLFLLKIFTWWNGQTFGTQLWTWRFGELVGEDEQGNRYCRTKGRKIDPTLGLERRWVTYNGYAEATRVPPSWHGWLHHTVDIPPTEESYTPREWEKPHVPNLTGTPGAYRPSGSTLASGRRPAATGDYQPWTPGRKPPPTRHRSRKKACLHPASFDSGSGRGQPVMRRISQLFVGAVIGAGLTVL